MTGGRVEVPYAAGLVVFTLEEAAALLDVDRDPWLRQRFDNAVIHGEGAILHVLTQLQQGIQPSLLKIEADVLMDHGCAAMLRQLRVRCASTVVRGNALELTLGTYAAVLTRQSRCAEARLALAEFFETSRRGGWNRLGQFGNACVELALGERRHSAAGRLLGYARAAYGRINTQRRCAELLAALATVLDSATLERLLAEGRALDEETVCALTLETAPSG